MLTGPGLATIIANALATVGSHEERSAAARAVVLVGELAYLGGLAARLGRELRPPRGAAGRARLAPAERWREHVAVAPVYAEDVAEETKLLARRDMLDAAWAGASRYGARADAEKLPGLWELSDEPVPA